MLKIYIADTSDLEVKTYEVVATEQVEDEAGKGEVVVLQPVAEPPEQKGK